MRSFAASFLAVALVLTSACAADDGTDPGDDLWADKADGFSFTRKLNDHVIPLSPTIYEGHTKGDEYNSFLFDADGPERVEVGFAWWGLNALLRGKDELGLSILLFRRDESVATTEALERQWSLVKRMNGKRYETMTYDVHQAGHYLVVMLSPTTAYQEGWVFRAVANKLPDTVEAQDPGTVHLAAVVSDGRAAAGVPVTIGTAHGVVDADGNVELQGVEAGEQLIKIGGDGTAFQEAITVNGGACDQFAAVTLTPEAYENALK